ncbi:uncharacterized protein LOC130826565 [Amaranthus tricolor]|uniref:uncharacterized protein LOC130826565 n=1 Tax=Amaranthus tricolor TaxID=29722 RepID=UPI002582601A|nr:uncharacterized protein LOC130826565 [Amaranthus tricolor]
MNRVKGQVVSSKPVSFSKAARILSKFVSSDNEASPAFAAYLKRAMGSFNELVQLHKDCKNSRSQHKGKLEIEATNKDGRKRKYESFSTGKLYASQEKHKSKKKKTQMQLNLEWDDLAVIDYYVQSY